MKTLTIQDLRPAITYEPPSPTEDWQDGFAQNLTMQGLSRNTIRAYVQDVRSFARWFEQHNAQSFHPSLVTGVDLRAYRHWAVDGRNMKPATWNRRLISLEIFCEWAKAAGHLDYRPFQGLDPWQQEEQPPRWLTDAEYHRFMRQVEINLNAATDHWKWQACRDHAIIALMIYAGLREGEVAALDVADIQLTQRKGKVTVWAGKGEKFRQIPLNSEARKALSTWIERNPGGVLFPGKRGDRLTTRTIQRIVQNIGGQAGLSVSPHDLRHTCAKRMVDRGVPLTVIQKILGHSRLDTTARYLKPGWNDLENGVENL